MKYESSYHYVYRITNTKSNKHYYGVRTCKINPEDDLGIKYFSSSTDKEFIKDQKENPKDYKYKVVRICNIREEATQLEIDLHEKFNVGVNENFYNRAKQTSSGFDTTGMKHTQEIKDLNSKLSKLMWANDAIRNKILRSRDFLWKQKISNANKNKVSVKNNNQNAKGFKVSLDDPRWINNELIACSKGRIPSIETRNKISEAGKGRKHSIETREKISKSNKGKIISDESKKKMSESQKGSKHPFFGKKRPAHSKFMIGNDYSKGRKHTKEWCKNHSIMMTGRTPSIETRKKLSEKNSGSSNPSALKIIIYNEKDEIMFKCHGNFKKVCEDNGLPYNALHKSYLNDSNKIYISINKRNLDQISKFGYENYIGWYATKL